MGERLEATWSLQQKNRRISERLWKRKYRRISGLDEAGVSNCEIVERGFSPEGRPPVLPVETKRQRVNMLSTVSSQGKVRFMIYPDTMNQQRLIRFMERLIRVSKQKVFLILDNLKVHHGKLAAAWLEHRKWRMFLSSSILAVIFSVGAFGFRSAANVQTRNSYDGYVAAASVAEERQAMEYFKSAINLKPSDETAYQELLKYVTRNNVITSEEDEGIRSIFNETNGTSRSNIEYLRLNNPDAYEVFAYEMGNAYFYTYEEANRKMKSQKWFEAAKSSSSLDVQKRARAECLEKIASYAGTLGVQNQAGDASTTYYDYWLDITSLISSDMISADNNVTALRSYKDFVFNVCTYMEHFLDEGVTQRDISAQLAIVKDAVTAMDVNASNSVEAKLKQDTFENINQAVKMLGASGVRTDEKSGEEAQ